MSKPDVSRKLVNGETEDEPDVENIIAELTARTEGFKRGKWLRLTLAALGSLPWIGSVISAMSALRSEGGHARVNELQGLWLEAHAERIGELETDLHLIIESAEQANPQASEQLQEKRALDVIAQGFRAWDRMPTRQKREKVRRILSNAAAANFDDEDRVRLFLSWVEQYDDTHFKVMSVLHNESRLTRRDIWERVDGRSVREDSAEADLFKLLIRDLSTGGVIRQHRETNAAGQYVLQRGTQRKNTTGVAKSAFDASEVYELTKLGSIFVRYALDEPTRALDGAIEDN